MPSNKILEQKQQIVADLTERIKNAKSGVIVSYMGLNVQEDTELRRELRKNNVEYTVVKNTLTRMAAKNVGYDALSDVFNGTTALATSEDFTAPAKVLCEFAKKHENLVVKAGFIDGEILDADGVIELSKIPSKEGLIAKLLGSIQGPLYGLAYALQAKIDKENGGEEAAAE